MINFKNCPYWKLQACKAVTTIVTIRGANDSPPKNSSACDCPSK